MDNNNENINQETVSPTENKEKKKKNKGLKIALIVIAAILVLAGAVFAYIYSTKKEYVQNKWAMMTKDDTEYFRWVMDKNIAKIEEDFAKRQEEAKSQAVNGTSNVESEAGEWDAEGSLSVSLNQELGSMFFGKTFAGILDAGVKYDISKDRNKNLGVNLIPFYKNVDLLEATAVINTDEKRLFAAIPSYRPEAIELSAIFEDSLDKVNAAKEKLQQDVDFDHLKSKLESLKDSFNGERLDWTIHVVYDRCGEATLEKKKDIAINGLEMKEANVLNVRLQKQECIEIVTMYLDSIEQDLKNITPDIDAILKSLKEAKNLPDAKEKDSDGKDVGSLGGDLLKSLLGRIDLGSGLKGLTSTVSGLGSIFGDMAGTVEIFSDKLTADGFESAWAAAREDILKKLEDASVSADLSFYVDDKGYIKGGSFKLNYNETKIKLDELKLKADVIDNETYINKNASVNGETVCAMEISLNGLKLASVLSEKENKDGKNLFNIEIKPGGMIEALVKGASNWVLTINGNISDKASGKHDIDLKVNLNGTNGELAHIYLVNSLKTGESHQLLNLSDENIIDIMDLADTDYIDLTEILKPILGKLDEINDEGLNNFLSSFMQSELGLTDMDVPGLKMMVDSGLTSAGNAIVKERLKKALGIEPPYDYSSIAEKPKMSKDAEGVYLYSWDVFKGASADHVYAGLNFKVYDYFDKPEAYKADLEAEKIKFLEPYMGQTFEREGNADDYVEMGDKVVFDVIPLLGGVAIESYAYLGEKTTVGNYDYGPGIDDKLVGVKKGETREVELTLGDGFGTFSGYTGMFRVTIQDITKVVEAGWTEKFIVGQLGYESVEALEKELLESAQQELDEIKPTDEQIRDAFFNSLIEGIDTDATGAEITETLKTEKLAEAENKKGRKKTVAEEEYSADTYFNACRAYVNALNRASSSELTELYQNMGFTMETVMKLMGTDESIPDYNLKRKIMIAAVAYGRNVTVTQQEYDIYMDTLASMYGYPDGNSFFEAKAKVFGQRFFVDAMIEAKVMDYLYSVSHMDLG